MTIMLRVGSRPIPTWQICSRPSPVVGRFLSADSSGFRILNMFNRGSRPTVTELVVESADSAVESSDYTTKPTADPVIIGQWVWALRPPLTILFPVSRVGEKSPVGRSGFFFS